MTGKVWFISGACSALGSMMARDALVRGDYVIAGERKAGGVAAKLSAHPNLLVVQLDVTKEDEALIATQQAIERFGRIDVLVNNAGFAILPTIEELSLDRLRAQSKTSVFGSMNVTRAVLPVLRRQRCGNVINISTVAGFGALHFWGACSSAKFAIGMSEALAMRLAPLGIKFTVVEPGLLLTDFQDSLAQADIVARIDGCVQMAGTGCPFAVGTDCVLTDRLRKLSMSVLHLADATLPPLRLRLRPEAAIDQRF